MLSSESISPPSFYKEREYGYKRFEPTVLSPFKNSLLAYSSIPLGSKYKGDKEEYDIFIRVPKSFLIIDKQYEVKSQLIIQISQPVYIDWIECSILIPSASQKVSLIASTRRSLESKNVQLYANTMAVFGTDYPKFDWNESYLLNIKDLAKLDYTSLLQDQRYNKIKGFVYGYMCGKLKERPSELTESKNHIYNFINLLSGVMNELSNLVNRPSRKRDLKIYDVLNELKVLGVKISTQLDSNQITNHDNDLKSMFGINQDVVEHLKTLKYKDSKLSIYHIVEEFIKSKEIQLYSVKELLDKLLTKLKQFINYPTQSGYQQLSIDFDLIQKIIKDRLGQRVQLEISNIEAQTFPFVVTSNCSSIVINLNEISAIDNDFLNIIINEFLSKVNVSTTDEIAQLRKEIVVSVAEKIKKEYKGKSVFELDYLRLLHRSMGTVGVGFKPQKTSKKSLEGLAYFLSRYSSIDKLQDYMDKNEFANISITYGIWGAAYGYANISKLFLKPLDFNVDARNLIFDYFTLVREKLVQGEHDTVKPIELELTNKTPEKTIEETDNQFLQIIKNNKKINKRDEWINEIMKCHNEILRRKDSNPSFFGNELLGDDFKALLTKSSKNLSQFGKAKIDEAAILFSEYLKTLKR